MPVLIPDLNQPRMESIEPRSLSPSKSFSPTGTLFCAWWLSPCLVGWRVLGLGSWRSTLSLLVSSPFLWNIFHFHTKKMADQFQVWPLAQFFFVSFLWKIIDLPGLQINDPSSGEILFSFVPPSNSHVSVFDPWRAFWADTAPFKDPQFAFCITEKLRHILLKCALGRHRVPRTLSRTTDANLYIAFIEN